jgi:hypothetical protein
MTGLTSTGKELFAFDTLAIIKIYSQEQTDPQGSEG